MLFSPFRTYEQLSGCGLYLFSYFHEFVGELSLISCSNYCGYFGYVISCENMLYENPCLIMIS